MIFRIFRHPRMGDAAKNPFVLPIFDTNYTVDLVWPPIETVDIGVLKKVGSRYLRTCLNLEPSKVVHVPFSSQDEFRDNLHEESDSLGHCFYVQKA